MEVAKHGGFQPKCQQMVCSMAGHVYKSIYKQREPVTSITAPSDWFTDVMTPRLSDKSDKYMLHKAENESYNGVPGRPYAQPLFKDYLKLIVENLRPPPRCS